MANEEQAGSEQYDELNRLLARYPSKDLVSQIPGQTSAGARTEEPRTLRQKAAMAVAQANPLMMGKSLQDMTRTLVGGAALPVVAPVSAGIQALNALPGNLLRRSRGEEEILTPSTEELMRKYGQVIAPRTQMGMDFEQGLGKAMDVAKVPHAWSMSPPAPRRPILTPTDVRVGAGQIRQLAKELSETPADFQAAQSGLKRQNLYGEDTLGVKVQAAADAVGDTLERRQMAGKSVIPGVPQALTPDNKMYAVRPKGSRIVQPKVPESARGYRPDVSSLEGIVENVYGDTPAAQMPPEMVSAEYAKRFLTPDSELAGAFKNYMTLTVQEMFPDAPTPRAAQNAYDTLYSNKTERTKQQMVELEEFLNLPENAAYRESAPTPTEFMQRMGEAERVIKGPFTTYLSKNVGAEGDPTVKLARQGITFESPEEIFELARFADAPNLAAKRLEAGFPIMGTYADEHFQKVAEFDALTREIEALEAVRQPLFDQAHAEGIDPASIPEYAEATNPLRQKLRQREQLQGEIKNIKLARAVEDISDSAIEPKTKQEMLGLKIPFEQHQFYPGVTKAAEGEKIYMGRESIIRDLGFNKLGKALVEDILTGKAGDTSKLTIENYMREKGLSRIEAEKAAKLQEQKYRETLQNTLLERIRSDQNVKTFGNAAIITLDKNTPKDVAMRDMSADTAVLDHCVGECGTAPQGRKNILTGKQQYYEPVFDPITGERSSRASRDTSYVRDLENGAELVSVRDIKTGLPAATIQLVPNRDGTFRIGYASGAKNKAVDAAYTPAIRDYLNRRSSEIRDTGGNLADNTGIFDINSPAEFKAAAREAGLNKDQAKALELNNDLPRFVTVDDIKAAAKGATSTEVAVVEPQRQAGATGAPMPQRQETISPARENELYRNYVDNFNRDMEAGSITEEWTVEELASFIRGDDDVGTPNVNQAEREALATLVEEHGLRDDFDPRQVEAPATRLQPDPLANLFDDLEPDDTAAANNPMLQYSPQTRELALRYDIPPVTVQEIQATLLNPRATLTNLNAMARNAVEGARGSIFENLPEESRLGAEQMIRDEIGRRAARANPAAAGLPLAAQDVYDLAGRYDVPPAMIRNIIAEVNGPVERAFELQNEAFTGAGRFATLQEASQSGAVRLIGDLLNERAQDVRNERQLAARAQPGQGYDPRDLSMARELLEIERDPDGSIRQGGIDSTAYALQTGQLDHPLVNHIPPGAERARALAPVLRAFVEQVYEQRSNENREQAPAQPALQMAQRDPVPRHIRDVGAFTNMSPAWNRQAQELADTYFNDNVIDGLNVSIGSLTSMLRDYRIGPHAEAPVEVRELAARRLENMHTEAEGSAEQVADALNEAMYMDMDPEEAIDAITRDINALERNGENFWEDLVGPMAEDIPWSRNVQHHLLGYLRALIDRYGDLREEGYAKGGMVKKKRKAKKARTSTVVTRRHPELAEMQYQYGGLVV